MLKQVWLVGSLLESAPSRCADEGWVVCGIWTSGGREGVGARQPGSSHGARSYMPPGQAVG